MCAVLTESDYQTTKAPEQKELLQLVDSDKQCELEIWRYDPTKISGDNSADVLSLVKALENLKDERVELSIEDMLNEMWR